MTNPNVSKGDRIVLYYMENETSVPPGTKGTVESVKDDPFDPNSRMIKVRWDNGSSLSLLTDVDIFKLDRSGIKEDTSETGDPKVDYRRNNPEIFKNFDWRFFREYLNVLRETGVVNMFGAAPLIYQGSESIERYYGEGREDDENFRNLLEMADDAKYKLVGGTISYLQKNNLDIDISSVQRYAEKFAKKILVMWMNFYD